MELSTIFILSFIGIVVIGVCSFKFSNRVQKKTLDDLTDVG
ncbi:MAG: hypothetical protein NTX56_07355 [Proteobacteria bacterium]|nr:hypothetical protein [Pseudomonadota bacterium]